MCMIWTCCDLWNGLINFYVRMISCVVCHSNSDKCWSDGVFKCFCGDICNVIWNDFCVSYCDCDFDICGSVTVILTCYACACPSGNVWGWSGVMPCVPSPVSCRCAWWWYSIQTICCYVAILITLKTMHVRAIMCNVAQFLILKTLIPLIGQHIDCRRG